MAYADFMLSDEAEGDLRRLPDAVQPIIEDELLEFLSRPDPEDDAQPNVDREGNVVSFIVRIPVGERQFDATWSVDAANNAAYILSIRETEEVREFQLRVFIRQPQGAAPIEEFFAQTHRDSVDAFDKIVAAMILLIQGLAGSSLVNALDDHPGLTELKPYYDGTEYRIYYHQTRIEEQQVYVLFDGIKKNVDQRQNQAVIDRCYRWLLVIRNDIAGLTLQADEFDEESFVRRFIDAIVENL
jgi:hypothetical protein